MSSKLISERILASISGGKFHELNPSLPRVATRAPWFFAVFTTVRRSRLTVRLPYWVTMICRRPYVDLGASSGTVSGLVKNVMDGGDASLAIRLETSNLSETVTTFIPGATDRARELLIG